MFAFGAMARRFVASCCGMNVTVIVHCALEGGRSVAVG